MIKCYLGSQLTVWITGYARFATKNLRYACHNLCAVNHYKICKSFIIKMDSKLGIFSIQINILSVYHRNLKFLP